MNFQDKLFSQNENIDYNIEDSHFLVNIYIQDNILVFSQPRYKFLNECLRIFRF